MLRIVSQIIAIVNPNGYDFPRFLNNGNVQLFYKRY